MNWRYGIHPKQFALGETEKYYTDMAAKGWELTKRGTLLSRFQKTEPKQMRYRVEVSAIPKILDDGHLPAEQIAVYEDCGWEYVSGHDYIHVFRTASNTNAPEFYLKPEQQAETLKSLQKHYRYYLWSPVTFLALLLIFLIPDLLFGVTTIKEYLAKQYLDLIRFTSRYVALGFLFLWICCYSLQGLRHLKRLVENMKKGIPLEHAPAKTGFSHKILPALCCIGFLCFLGHRFLSTSSSALPEAADGPYLLLSDLGVYGVPSTASFGDRESSVTNIHSLAAEYWYTEEFRQEDNQTTSLRQDIYRLRNKDGIPRLINALLIDSSYEEFFTPIDIPGLDQAFIADHVAFIAVKGNEVHYVEYYADSVEQQKEILAILAEH